MSASTLAISPNPAMDNNASLALGSKPNPRRRIPVVTEKKSIMEMVGEGGGVSLTGDEKSASGKDLNHSIGGEKVLEGPKDLLQAKRTHVNSTASPRRSRKVVAKPVKPTWKTVVSVFTKNVVLIVVVLGLVQMIRNLGLKYGGNGVGPMGALDFEGRIAEVEAFLKTTTKMMQVQVDVVDRKIENEVGGLRRELSKSVEEKGLVIQDALKSLEVRTDGLEKSLGELRGMGFIRKEDFDRFLEELKNSKSGEEGDNDWSLDEIRAFAREVVDKEIERHAADGLGMVDYALSSGGGMVIRHSEPFHSGKGSWFPKSGNRVHIDAQKMLQPSFGEPGQCFPVKGSSGFVEIRLRTTIIPEAVTLEHVAKSVSYDRSSAPKDCRVSAWLEGHNSDQPIQAEKMFLLAEFTYDLEKSNAQTFNVDTEGIGTVNMIRLDFTSNHGSPHTCIYRYGCTVTNLIQSLCWPCSPEFTHLPSPKSMAPNFPGSSFLIF